MSKIITEAECLKLAMDSYDKGKADGQKGVSAFINSILATALAAEKKVQLIADFVKAWDE